MYSIVCLAHALKPNYAALLRHNDPAKVAFLQSDGLRTILREQAATSLSNADWQTLYRIVFFIQQWVVDEPLLCAYMIRELGNDVLDTVAGWCALYADDVKDDDDDDEEDPWRWQIADKVFMIFFP